MTSSSSPSKSDLESERRTTLADSRTAMAADRTLMAWIRTALAMISFGFTIYKVLQGLNDTSAIRTRHPNGPRELGLFLVALGTLSIAGGMLQYARALRKIGGSESRLGFTFFVACAVLVVGLLVLFGIVTRLGPF